MIKDFSADSGERISMLTEDRINTDHLARYNYAAEKIVAKFGTSKQLFGADIFCGSGYGTNILARDTGAIVIGIDGSGEAIERARNSFPRENAFYSQKYFPFELPLASFDFVCSFESIEHVLDYKKFAEILSGSVKNGGLLFVSCPNVEKMDLDINPYHWHYKHLDPVEFEALFPEKGFTLLSGFSTTCIITNDKREYIASIPFAVPRNEIKTDLSGDTMFFVFKKEAA